MTSQPAPGNAQRSSRSRLRRGKSNGPQPYDFRRPTKLSREHIRLLQLAYETFVRQYTTLLTTSLRTMAQVNLVSVEQFSYDEYISSLGNPTMMTMILSDPLPGPMIHEFSITTAMSCIDHMLGGPGGPDQPERPLTEIEFDLIRGLLERILSEFKYSFESIISLHPTLGPIEYNPQFAQAYAPSDTMVVAVLDIKIGEEESTSTICLPLNGILPRLQALTEQGTLSEHQRLIKEAAAQAVSSGLEMAPVDVTVKFSATPAKPSDIVNLAVGDVIRLRHRTQDPLTVMAGGVTFAHAVPGVQGNKLACLVVDTPEEERS